jgi:serine/threonine-protein kinase
MSVIHRLCRKLISAALLMASIVALAPVSAQQAYRHYRNARFGVSVDVPSGWKAEPPPENNDGLVFSSPDGAATITVSGILNAGNAPAARVIAEEPQTRDGETVVYRNKSVRQAVISGTRGDVIFYRKVILSCNDRILNHFAIEYPATRKQALDVVVSHVAASMRASPGEQIPNCR